MNDTVSIEYAHIYTNQRVSEEHTLSVQKLSEAVDMFRQKSIATSLVVMVDDYSFPDPSFDYDTFLSWLNDEGYRPDLMIRESQLIPVCDLVLRVIDDEKLKTQITDYVKAKKYPCSLFIAAWYLLRLGAIESEIFPAHLRSKSVFNILPESFKPFEDKGLEIISKTPYAERVKAITYEFLPGRLIA